MTIQSLPFYLNIQNKTANKTDNKADNKTDDKTANKTEIKNDNKTETKNDLKDTNKPKLDSNVNENAKKEVKNEKTNGTNEAVKVDNTAKHVEDSHKKPCLVIGVDKILYLFTNGGKTPNTTLVSNVQLLLSIISIF